MSTYLGCGGRTRTYDLRVMRSDTAGWIYHVNFKFFSRFAYSIEWGILSCGQEKIETQLTYGDIYSIISTVRKQEGESRDATEGWINSGTTQARKLHLEHGSCNKQKKALKTNGFQGFDGGDKRDRTADLLNAIQALSQLSYTPILCPRMQTAFEL